MLPFQAFHAKISPMWIKYLYSNIRNFPSIHFGDPPLHNCDLISIKIICYFYNFPTLCIDRQCCAMRIEEGQKYDFAKIGKYGCGEPEKNCCKSWLPFSSLSTGERRGGDGCLLPAAHQIDPRGFPNILGTSWGPPIYYVRTIGDFPLQWERRSAPPFWERLD